MSSQGEGNAPLGNEGPPNDPFAPIEWEETCLERAYDLLEAILHERQTHILAALASNVQRHGLRERWIDWTAAGSVVAAAANFGHPILGVAVAAAIGFGRTVYDTLRLRTKKGASARTQAMIEARMFMLFVAKRLSEAGADHGIESLPDVVEFKTAWIRSSWRLVHYLKGYNTRMEALKAIMSGPRTETEQRAANAIWSLTQECRPRLLRAKQLLDDFYFASMKATKGRLEATTCLDERVEEADPFHDRLLTAPPLDWLLLPYDSLVRDEVPRQAVKDWEKAQAGREIHVQDIDRRFAELEQRQREKTDTDPDDDGQEVDLDEEE